MLRIRFMIFALLCVGRCVPVIGAGTSLKVAGTDLLGAGFSKSLYEWAGRHELTLEIALDGSLPGIDRLKSGRAQLALFMLPRDAEDGLAGFERVPFAYERVVVLVPSAAQLSHVSLDQLGGIFGADGREAAHWDELGVGGGWSGSPIAARAPVAGAGIVAEFFRCAVLHGGAFKSNVGRYEEHADLVALLAGDSRVIALAAAPLQSDVAQVMPVSARTGSPAYLPTPENLRSGDYPLGLPLCLGFRRESAAELQPLLHLLLSDELVPLIENAGLVPLPPAARHQQAAALDKL